MKAKYSTRKATLRDAHHIHRLILVPSKRGEVLYRPYSEICEFIRDFSVVENSRGSIVGVGSLHVWWDDLGEIRTLVVKSRYRKKGIGKAIVRFLIDEAKFLGLKRVFALTRIGKLFQNMGFRAIDKSLLPQKVWVDCIKCPRFMNCDEEAFVLDI